MIDHFTFLKSNPVQTSDKKFFNNIALMRYFTYL